MSNCKFVKIVPSSDSIMCSDHYSIGSFRQGIFDTTSLDLKRKIEIIDWLNTNKNIVTSIECFLLKHPLFDIPLPAYPMFSFLHHAQIGFIFKDKDGNQIRHFCLQLQNGWWPPVSSTVPFNLAQPCKIVNPDGTSRIETNLLDQTAIFAHFLEPENYMAENIVEMNKYTNFKGINLNFLTGNVNFNFFLESYRIWRLQNTDIEHTPELIEQFNFISDYGQVQKGPDNQIVKLKGTGDGKLFVLNTFSPAYWSINEGTILHFATIPGNTDKFKSFIEWNFNNLQCYDNPRQHNKGYARTYNTLSTSTLSLDWAIKNIKDFTSFDNLIKCIRPIGENKALWSTTTDKWDPNGTVEMDYEKIMTGISNCTNLGQMATLKYGEFQYDYSSCALVATASNYNCETYSSMIISMILNTDTFDNVDRKFDFNFPGISNEDANYTLSQNLMRMYAAYWPVAIYENGYENGIFESDFNNSNDPNIIADRAEYAKQSMIFQYLFGGLNIEAADATGNPVLKALTELFTMPMINTILGVLPKSASTMAPILNNMMYCIFLYEFLKVETVYLSGYKFNNINNNGSFDLYRYYDCEPSIYKFKIGTSTKRGVANSKLLLAVLKWITKGRTDLLTNFKLFKDSNLTSKQQQKINDIETKFNNAETSLNDLIYFKPTVCDPIQDCSKIPEIPNPINRLNCQIKNMESRSCSMQNNIERINYATTSASNTVDGLLEIIRNRDVTVPLIKELGNFVFEKADIFANIIIGNMQRFTTWCHQNYELNPNIMAAKNLNTNSVLGNLIRRPDGICKDFATCSLSDKNLPSINKVSVNFQTKKLYTEFNNKNILEGYNGFIILIIIIVLLFVSLLIFLCIRTKKNLNKLD